MALTSCGTDDRVFCRDIAIGDRISEYDVVEGATPIVSAGFDVVGDCSEWTSSSPDGGWVEIDAQPPKTGAYDYCEKGISDYYCSAAVDGDGKILCVHH